MVVRVRQRPIPPELIGRDLGRDTEFRTGVQNWVNGLWEEKDRLLDELSRPVAPRA